MNNVFNFMLKKQTIHGFKTSLFILFFIFDIKEKERTGKRGKSNWPDFLSILIN